MKSGESGAKEVPRNESHFRSCIPGLLTFLLHMSNMQGLRHCGRIKPALVEISCLFQNYNNSVELFHYTYHLA